YTWTRPRGWIPLRSLTLRRRRAQHRLPLPAPYAANRIPAEYGQFRPYRRPTPTGIIRWQYNYRRDWRLLCPYVQTRPASRGLPGYCLRRPGLAKTLRFAHSRPAPNG